ncbi:cilia- and flagella-associated protein 91-like [Venturia canescens]|uniref:cilia- and flagella-associated protein 91-like n=1 Tax=Venturia canescens TaxID=32260 RepID=UPI001C9BF45C|nr:cilia- and flagella-associated protein 91-like [Venturia canescens]
MSISVTKCAAASIIIKSCYQPSICRPESKSLDHEKRSRSPSYRIHGSGGGDGDEATTIYENRNNEELAKCKGTQTDYRESESQTSPWEAPYKIAARSKKKPEILSLRTSTWGNGLPAGMHEILRIKRMRMKRAWLEVLPPMDTPENVKICDAIISAIEANEWAFREAEIQFVMESQLELLEKMRENKAKIKQEIIGQRIERFANRLGQQRDQRIVGIRGKFLREVRKLNRKHRGSSAATYKLHRSDIIARYANPSSHMYAPEMRFGFKSKPSHEILDKTLLSEAYVTSDIAVDDSLKWLPTNGELKDSRLIRRADDLCIRRTRWTDEKLKKLHADLKSIRLNESKKGKKERPQLLKRKIKLPALPVTPLRRRTDDKDNYWESSSLFLQKITRGRAVQCMMYEGRDRCRELIEELKSTDLLKDPEEISHRNNAANVFAQSREQRDRFIKDNRLDEVLDSLEGISVAGLLDMLSKEETRLREERKAHALAMLIERERTRREAEEAGRRQLERNRRRELDEMFRQVVKVNQDTVQAYLEGVINEEIEISAEREAKQYVEGIADEIDASVAEYQEQEPDPIRDQEMIADMVHNFLLPEVNKQMMRQKIHDRQQGYLREAHLMIYNEMKNLKSGESDNLGDSVDEKIHEDEEKVDENSDNLERFSSGEFHEEDKSNDDENKSAKDFGQEQSYSEVEKCVDDNDKSQTFSSDESHGGSESMSEEDIELYDEIKKLT